MNEVLKYIEARRSIRVYKTEQIKEEELQAILRAGMYAPSAMNQQSWHFTIIQNKGVVDKINQTCKELLRKSSDKNLQQRAGNESYHVFYNAPTVIIVSGDEKAIMPHTDCAAATENMLIASESLGIGSCWIGIAAFLFNTQEGDVLKKELGIPEGFKPLYIAAFGYKGIESPMAAPRRENTVNYIK